ncbi:type IV toxin-antitoxin system AbiEi family antitoxin domain-containing protein [Nocardioides sp. J54]|uniref:type IV toxin-antitoxin system AbiEi family antitoxin domain-containing protein n=1 Tax=Nocardioides sp. J54 TaxID=935866 RepID=UPI00048D1F2E|nr:type IV toxin-antitoxin system AbiEi family antitoxin domain-containing protein [Nocardioides sp. J54]
MNVMNARVQAAMSAQWGLVTRPQALAAGMTADQVDRLVRSGRWALVRRGVYAEAPYVASLTSHAEQRMLADRAASLRVRDAHVFSHHSAAYVLGLEVLREPDPLTHLTRPGIVGTHRRAGIAQHLAPYPPEQLQLVHGVGVLGLARTAVDITREHGYLQGLVAADSAMRVGVSREQLCTVAAQMYCWPQSTVVRDVLASASPGADSVGETLMRDLVASLGFGVPEVQFGLTADGRTAWCDLRLGRQVFEFDGKVKFLSPADGGFAQQPPTDVLWAEKGRQDFVTGFKLGVCRVTWADVWGAGVERARERLRREFLRTCELFGTDVADLARFRPRGARPRPQVRRPAYRLLGWERWAA